MIRRLTFGAAIAATLLLVSTLTAAPGFWQSATQADFLRGEVDQLSIDEHGRLMLGPSTTRMYDPGVPFVWTTLAGADGSVFLGTGNDGRVMRVDREGRGSVFFDSAELEVHALAPAPDGGVYVGTSPDGRIYRVDATGSATPFFDPDDNYIWSLAVDRQGNVFAATGGKGTVYRITPDGTGQPFFETKATHAVALTFDAGQRLLVGTGSPGRVYRVDSAGKGFLLLDTPYEEIHAVRVDPKGVIYAAAQSRRSAAPAAEGSTDAPPPPPVTPTIPNVSTEVTSFTVIDVQASAPMAATATTGTRGGAAGAVYRVLPDGLWDEIWTPQEDAPYDLAIEPDGSLLVATGPKGKLFRLNGDPIRSVLLTRVPAQHATLITRAGERTLIATANPGLLIDLSQSHSTSGSYESDVKDARFVSTWGVISWKATVPAGARVEVYSRSGNTPSPDDAWSEWAGPYADSQGSPVTNPNARYLQWRVVLGGAAASPVLTSITSSFLPRNTRPRVTDITVHGPGVVFQKPFSSGETEIAGFDDGHTDRQAVAAAGGAPALGRRTYQKGLQTFVWKADDENGDELTYAVYYRREGETAWRELKTDLRDTLMVWDTSSVPNGRYVVKISASDRKSNPVQHALDGELESSGFEIDNISPSVTIGAVRQDGGQFVVPAEVRDADSPVLRVEYSLDAQRWQAAFPIDGILDGRLESFEIRLDGTANGRTLVLRATDALGNVGVGEAIVRVAGR